MELNGAPTNSTNVGYDARLSFHGRLQGSNTAGNNGATVDISAQYLNGNDVDFTGFTYNSETNNSGNFIDDAFGNNANSNGVPVGVMDGAPTIINSGLTARFTNDNDDNANPGFSGTAGDNSVGIGFIDQPGGDNATYQSITWSYTAGDALPNDAEFRFSLDGVGFELTQIPEPSSFLLFLTAVFGMCFRRNRL